MDFVAQQLSSAVAILSAQQIEYEVMVTKPDRTSFALSDDCLYVVRQTKRPCGVYQLVAAAKMKKEV